MRWPSWILVVFLLAWMGPMMRWILGSERTPKRLRPRDRKEFDTRLEDALASRDQVIEDLQQRISELESRLDFTERLLAERSQAALP